MELAAILAGLALVCLFVLVVQGRPVRRRDLSRDDEWEILVQVAKDAPEETKVASRAPEKTDFWQALEQDETVTADRRENA